MLPVFYPEWKTKVMFSPEGPRPQILVEHEKLKVVLAGLEAGQMIPSHPENLAVYYFLEGSGWMTVDGQRYTVHAGSTMVTAEGSSRGVEAETRLVFLAMRIS